MPIKLQPSDADLAREAAAEREKARLAQLRQQSQERFAQHQQSLEQQKADLEAKRAAYQAEMERMNSLKGTVKYDPETQTTFGTYYGEKTVQEREAKMQARKEHRDASKDVRNVPGWIVAGLPPNDSLKQQAKLMEINPEDYQ